MIPCFEEQEPGQREIEPRRTQGRCSCRSDRVGSGPARGSHTSGFEAVLAAGHAPNALGSAAVLSRGTLWRCLCFLAPCGARSPLCSHAPSPPPRVGLMPKPRLSDTTPPAKPTPRGDDPRYASTPFGLALPPFLFERIPVALRTETVGSHAFLVQRAIERV